MSRIFYVKSLTITSNFVRCTQGWIYKNFINLNLITSRNHDGRKKYVIITTDITNNNNNILITLWIIPRSYLNGIQDRGLYHYFKAILGYVDI